MTNAYRDENSVPTLIASSNVDGQTPVRLYADPTTHRLLVDMASGGITIMTATGAVDDSNVDFTFASEPTIVVVNGASYRVDHGWTWNAGTLTATLSGPVGTGGDIYGIS